VTCSNDGIVAPGIDDRLDLILRAVLLRHLHHSRGPSGGCGGAASARRGSASSSSDIFFAARWACAWVRVGVRKRYDGGGRATVAGRPSI
jgi:hypothetical protein